MTMSLLPYLILLVLVHESFENGVVFTECDYTQCGGREPIYTPFKSYNVSFRMECLIRCLDNSFCNFIGHHDKQCTLYPSLDPLYDMQPSDLEWRFWSRPNPCELFPCLNSGCCVQDRDTFKCLCPEQYAGSVCGEKVDCASNPCKNAASCFMISGLFSCSCPSGFTGTLCDQILP
ncbi:delta and Notch-like epidermal growth factor-related receptor [Crassostrea angulata]|uniref:delta and Notch-like epidermal growth factor-related receptor n=1 Tax=Magallana angulata TaxID=2784310 RepID=UPI0022B1ED5D|nr:delta and Notch-like epidermal growth factor-related receptor [Crassostrea angulata]